LYSFKLFSLEMLYKQTIHTNLEELLLS